VSATAFGIFRKFGPPPAARRLFARLPTPGAAASATAGPYKINDAPLSLQHSAPPDA
jgi:hypothetical protein